MNTLNKLVLLISSHTIYMTLLYHLLFRDEDGEAAQNITI